MCEAIFQTPSASHLMKYEKRAKIGNGIRKITTVNSAARFSVFLPPFIQLEFNHHF